MKLLLCVLALAGMAAGQSDKFGNDSFNVVLPAQRECANGSWKKSAGVVTLSCVPRSVPAVRKTRKINLCGWSFDHVDCEHNGFREEQYWTCADPDRALIVSQNGKKAACLLVEAE